MSEHSNHHEESIQDAAGLPEKSEFDRRKFIKGAAATAAALSLHHATLPEVSAKSSELVGELPLRELADKKGFRIGGILNSTMNQGSPSYKTDFNSTVIDGTGSFHWIDTNYMSGNPEDFRFNSLEQTLTYNQENDMKAQVHHMTSGNNGGNLSIPKWVPDAVAANGGDPVPVIKQRVDIAIPYMQENFPGVVESITAVNEPINPYGYYGDVSIQTPKGPQMWTNFWSNASAYYYGDPRYYAVETLKAMDEKITKGTDGNRTINLLTNEYMAEMPYTSKGDEYVNLVNYLVNEQGAPLDGVGFQMHLAPLKNYYENGISLLPEEIDSFAQLFGEQASRFPVPPFITEFDIDTDGWRQAGYSSDQIMEFKGQLVYKVTQALINAGGKSMMFFQPEQFTAQRSSDTSPIWDIQEAISELPDIDIVSSEKNQG